MSIWYGDLPWHHLHVFWVPWFWQPMYSISSHASPPPIQIEANPWIPTIVIPRGVLANGNCHLVHIFHYIKVDACNATFTGVEFIVHGWTDVECMWTFCAGASIVSCNVEGVYHVSVPVSILNHPCLNFESCGYRRQKSGVGKYHTMLSTSIDINPCLHWQFESPMFGFWVLWV
jgi:hypothetical protein